jgi:hypothetical protein
LFGNFNGLFGNRDSSEGAILSQIFVWTTACLYAILRRLAGIAGVG